MLKFIFKKGNRTFDPKIVSRSTRFARLSSAFSKDIGFIKCPNHKEECSATILIDTAQSGLDRQIINSCCPDYKQALDSLITNM